MTGMTRDRDLRIDFFRGLALIMIFINHIPDNGLSSLTLRSFGFSDAAELFVFLAGYSAVLAYSRAFDTEGYEAGAMRVGQRIFQIYSWHLVLLVASFALLFTAAMTFGDPAYLHNIGMWEFVFEPVATFGQALWLVHQPNMLNILPLYIALLAWFPVLFWLIRRSSALALAVSFAIWLAANLMLLNLPSNLEAAGWVFNPFAWQLLFAMGAVAADSYGVRRVDLPVWVVMPAALFLAFAFVVAAPWTLIPGLQETRLISAELIGHVDKTYLSLWRLAHVLALVCLIGYLVRPQAEWLQAPVAGAVAWLGRHSLEIFSLGTILSFTGWIVLNEAGTGLVTEVAVIATGIGVMTWTAWNLERRKQARRRGTLSAAGPASSSSFGVSPRSQAGSA